MIHLIVLVNSRRLKNQMSDLNVAHQAFQRLTNKYILIS